MATYTGNRILSEINYAGLNEETIQFVIDESFSVNYLWTDYIEPNQINWNFDGDLTTAEEAELVTLLANHDRTIWDNKQEAEEEFPQGSADEVYYDSSDSGLAATNLKDAIDEVEIRVSTNDTKVSADGSINSHSDVDTTTLSPSLDNFLKWDGSKWIPGTGDGLGDMLKSVYDPTNINGSAFDYNNFINTPAIPSSSDDISEGSTNLFYTDARVSSNINVTANTTDRHTHSNKNILNNISNAGSGIIITATERTKLSGIEDNAEVNPTAAETKTIYESNANTNSFTDSEQTKLSGIEAGAEVNPTAAETKTIYESNADTNAFTDTEQTKLSGIEAGAEVNPTAAETKTIYESNTDTNAYTDAEKTKLSTLETSKFLGTYTSLTALEAAHPSPAEGSYAHVDQGTGQDLVVYIWDNGDGNYVLQQGESAAETPATIKTKYETNADTNAFTDSEKTKLSGIEASAEVNPTAAEIKTEYESNSDTNAFTDSEKTKLNDIEAGAEVNSDANEIKTLYESNIDTNVFTNTEKTKLIGIESGAEVNPTVAETKTLYESNANTNAFTDTEQTKLSGIEANAEVNTITSVNTLTGAVILNTDNISEGSNNLYYTDARFDSRFTNQLSTKTTSNLLEGSNLYYTDARVDARISLATFTHGNLNGLNSDDHTQYILVDGTRNFSNIVSYTSHPTFSQDTEIVDKKYVDEALTVRDLANLQIERTTNFSATTTWTNITFDQVDLVTEPDVLYLDDINNDRIRIDTTGTFIMACKVLPTNGTSQRYDIRLRLNDTTIIPGSESFVDIYANESHELTIACSFNAVAGDYVSLQGLAESSGTFQANTGLSITKLDGVKGIDGVDGVDGVDGATGPTGPAGSGVKIQVADDGTTLVDGPFEEINFIGEDVTVTANGMSVDVEVAEVVLPVYGTEWQLASNTAVSSTTSTNEQTKVTLVTTSLPSGNYKLTAHWVGRHTPANSSAYFDVTQNGSPIGVVSEMEKEFKDVNNDEPMSRSYFLNLSGIQTFALRYWNESGTVTISDAHLEIMRLN